MYWGAYPPVRRVEYDRDILDRVTEVRAEVADQMQPILTDIQYRADGQITAATFGNGLRETRTYDQQGRLVYQDLKVETDLIIGERTYTYDPSGNITVRTGAPGDQHYAYDGLDRLTGQDIQADGKTWQYDYGPNHNRQSRKDGDLLEELYSYQPDTNRLTEVDKLFGAPDPETPTSRQFTYNQANRFSEYVEDGQMVASYVYNALGQRTRKELEAGATVFHYNNGIQLLVETDDTGNSQKDYIWFGIRPIAQIDSTGLITYLHTDHLLTPRIGTSDAQTIVWQWEGEAFGDIETAGSMEVNLRFPGQYFDSETEHHYNYFRDYAPGLGRYFQSDSIGLQGGNNTFSYAFQNPNTYFDPTGEAAVCFAGPYGAAACAAIGAARGFQAYRAARAARAAASAARGISAAGAAASSSSGVNFDLPDESDEPDQCDDDPPSDDECWERCKHLLPSPSGDLQSSEFRRCWRKCKGTL